MIRLQQNIAKDVEAFKGPYTYVYNPADSPSQTGNLTWFEIPNLVVDLLPARYEIGYKIQLLATTGLVGQVSNIYANLFVSPFGVPVTPASDSGLEGNNFHDSAAVSFSDTAAMVNVMKAFRAVEITTPIRLSGVFAKSESGGAQISVKASENNVGPIQSAESTPCFIYYRKLSDL